MKPKTGNKQKVFLWDVDGVLIWHHPLDPLQDWRSQFSEKKLLETWESFQMSPLWLECLTDRNKCVQNSWKLFVKKQYGNVDVSNEVIKVWLDNNVKPCQAALECLIKLYNKEGYSCAIASNQDAKRAAWLRKWLAEQGLDDLPLFISCDLGLAKPDRAFFKKVEEKLTRTGNEFILLDDRSENTTAAQAHGWGAHHITPDFPWQKFYDKTVNGSI